MPDYEPDDAWVPAAEVWSDSWSEPGWEAGALGCAISGLVAEGGLPQAQDYMTHLLRRVIHLVPPQPHMRISEARLRMWSDNKSAWYWQGVLIARNREAMVGVVDLVGAGVDPGGGRNTLAVQTSNDYAWGQPNPQGTGYRLCVVWTHATPWRIRLPLTLK
jgi:hypothetical protein